MNYRTAQPHPGHILRERILPSLGLSVSDMARMLRISRQTLHTILAGTASVTPEMALRLARLSGTHAEFWLSLQQQHDLRRAEETMTDLLRDIPVHSLPHALRVEIGCHDPTY